MTDIWKVNEKLNIDQDLMRITHDYLIEKIILNQWHLEEWFL